MLRGSPISIRLTATYSYSALGDLGAVSYSSSAANFPLAIYDGGVDQLGIGYIERGWGIHLSYHFYATIIDTCDGDRVVAVTSWTYWPAVSFLTT